MNVKRYSPKLTPDSFTLQSITASNNLKGKIPSEIKHLKKLDFLSLKHNELSGSIPSALKELTLLDYLDLKLNQLTGSIPHFLGDLQRLQVLGLSKNQLEGTLPGSLGTLGLKTLAIDGNILTGDLAPVAMMTSLEYLYAEENDLHGNLDHGLLADLKSLIEADLSGNRLESAQIPTHLFSLPQLRVLDLSDNSISGSLPESLPDNSVLEYLNLRMNSMPSSIPDSISNLRALTHLDLEANAFTGDLPADSLASLKDLSYLFLGKNPLNDAIMPGSFQSLTGLRELSMDDVGLQGEIPTWMGNLSNLKLLDLRNNQLTGGSLEAVDFSNMNELTYFVVE
jgi:Leucine-rich repeat (LRR) protein